MAHTNLGIVLMEQKKLAEGVAAFKKAADLKPDFAWSHVNLGKALEEHGKPAEAVAALR